MQTQIDPELDEFDHDIKVVPSLALNRSQRIQASGSCGQTCTCVSGCQETCITCFPPSCGGTCDEFSTCICTG